MTDLAGAVAAVVPVVVRGRAEAERRRCLPSPTLCALEQSGLLSAKVPAELHIFEKGAQPGRKRALAIGAVPELGDMAGALSSVG